MNKDSKLDEAKAAMVKKILSDLEDKGADWVCSWVKTGGPQNPVTRTRYRGRNALLLLFAMELDELDDCRFMTFKQAKEAGYNVKKGCHGYPIERWRELWHDVRDPERRVKQPRNAAERQAYADDPNMCAKWLPVGHFTVFNARDIEGIPPLETPCEKFAPQGAALVDYLEQNGPCKVSELMQDRAYYSPLEDAITMPTRGQFQAPESMARILLHEMGHATGRRSRLDRPQLNEFGSPEYAKEELVAELSSIFTASALGVSLGGAQDAGLDAWGNHVAYLRNWLQGLGDDAAAEIMRAATLAADASDWLMAECFAGAREQLAAA